VKGRTVINPRDAAHYFGITMPRVKQLLTELNLPVIRDPKNHIQIPTESMRALAVARGFKIEPKVGTVAIEKGGTGKTVITLNLALTAARYGRRTLICDFDPECCGTLFLAGPEFNWDDYDSFLEVFSEEDQIASCVQKSRFDGVDFLPAKSIMRKLDRDLVDHNPKTLLRKRMQGLLEMYDLILFDLPPSFTRLCASAYLTSDFVVCPVNSDIFSIESLKLTLEDIEEACEEYDVNRPQIYVLKNRFVETSKNKASKDIGAELNREFPDLVLPFQIRASASLTNSLNSGLSIYDCPKETGIESIRSSFQDLLGVLCPAESSP
jgi:chromosome partitioning protein